MKKITCKHCNGSTRCACNHCSANSALGVPAICKACGGKGYVQIADDAEPCRHCGGRTSCACVDCGDGLGHAARCHVCGGTGYA